MLHLVAKDTAEKKPKNGEVSLLQAATSNQTCWTGSWDSWDHGKPRHTE